MLDPMAKSMPIENKTIPTVNYAMIETLQSNAKQ